MPNKLQRLERDLIRTYQALRTEIERQAIAEVERIAKGKPKGTVVEFCSAMGSTTLTVRNPKDYFDVEINTPFMRKLDRIENDWGYGNTMPTVYIRAKNGHVKCVHDWSTNPWKGTEVE